MSKLTFAFPLGRPTGTKVRFRLYCFHHAGGSAHNFAKWPGALPGIDVWAVQLPCRFQPACIRRADNLDELLPVMADEISRVQVEGPAFAFYGHSLGALVAFELAQTLSERSGPNPFALAVSGHRAPRCALTGPRLADLDQPALIELLRSLKIIPDVVLADPHAMSSILPTLYSDILLSENYIYRERPQLSLQLYGFRGRHDPLLTSADLHNWAIETTGPSKFRTLPGGHFFHDIGLRKLLSYLSTDLVPPVEKANTDAKQ